MPTKTKFVFLMHPKEFKKEKAATGRLTHLCLPNSEIHVGTEFDEHEEVQALIRDGRNRVVLLYPGTAARNISRGELSASEFAGLQLVILLLDATWPCARKMLRLSPSLQRIPRVTFDASSPSRYVIKQQPQVGCLSTLEATHDALTALARHGLDSYTLPGQLLGIFQRMQDFQIQCAQDPAKAGYRRKPYSLPSQRSALRGASRRRSRFIRS